MAVSEQSSTQRQWPDRRMQTLRALAIGNIQRRRRGLRRREDVSFAAVDWHDSRWLAVALLILILSLADAFLTLTLIAGGAEETNPIMEPLVARMDSSFIVWKLGLTACSIIVLTLLVRVRAFGMYVAGLVLYTVLAAYVALIGYELWLLNLLPM
jgi:hypothetical protein